MVKEKSPWEDVERRIKGLSELSEETLLELQEVWERQLEICGDRENRLVELKNREIEGLKDLLRDTNRHMLFINEVGQQITASLDLDSIIRTFHRTVRDHLPCERLLLATYQSREESLYYRYYGKETQEDPEVETIYISAAHRMVVECLKDGKTVVENHLAPEEECFLTRRGGALMILPLRLGASSLGALLLHSDETGVFNESHRHLLGALAIFLAVAVTNAQSHQEVALLNKELQGEKEELITTYARITRMANYDSLTDLPNLRLLNEFLPRYMNQARRQKWTLGVFFIDLDDFKPVNDRFGHDVGDALLIQVGKRILQSLRRSDIVARVGGDEFIALVQGLQGEKDAENIVQKLLEALEEPFSLREEDVRIGASVGISLYYGGDETPEILKRQADSAMYAVKHRGKHSYGFFREESS